MSPLFSFFLLHIIVSAAGAQLRPHYYSESCPKAEAVVRHVMKKALNREPRSLASVMRFQFHDCFVNVSELYIKITILRFLISFSSTTN